MKEHVEYTPLRDSEERHETQLRRCDAAMAIGVIAVAFLLAAVALSTSGSSEPGAQASPPSAETAPGTTSEFIYYPSQYVNQAKEREEHIEAF